MLFYFQKAVAGLPQMQGFLSNEDSQLTPTCSKSAIKTLGKGLKYVQSQ